MGHHFEQDQNAVVPASAEQVWEAIATGPGIDSWFMGRNDVEPGSVVRTVFGGYEPEHPVTDWQPPARLRYGGQEAPDGRSIAYEFLVEARDQGSAVVRMVASGFLPGDDWADELDAMGKGHRLFFATLVEYLTHFAGRTATPVTAFGPPVEDWEATWDRLRGALGLPAAVTAGSAADLSATPARSRGRVYYADSDAIAIRAEHGLYRFIKGFGGPLIAGHHEFSSVDPSAIEQSWSAWLHDLQRRPLTDQESP